MAEIVVVRNDFDYTLTFNVKESDGTAFNLQSDTVVLKVALPGATSLTFNGNCSVTDAAGGVCTYTVGSTDFTTAGEYEAELQISGVQLLTARMDNIVVVNDLPST